MSRFSPALRELQLRMSAALTEPQGVDVALANAGGLPFVAESRRGSRRLRVAIYADAYFSRLLEALEEDFPILRREMGDEAFRFLAASYLQAHPSTSPTLADLGAKLPEFLLWNPPDVARRYLVDVARLENEVWQCLHTPRGALLDPARLAALTETDWSTLRMGLSPSVSLLSVQYPVEALWRNEPWTEASPRHRGLLVYRDSTGVQVEALDLPEWFSLGMLRAGYSLEEIASRLEAMNVSPEQVTAWFGGWVAKGLLTAWTASPRVRLTV